MIAELTNYEKILEIYRDIGSVYRRKYVHDGLIEIKTIRKYETVKLGVIYRRTGWNCKHSEQKVNGDVDIRKH